MAFFSASGVTRTVAKELAEATGADMYEIRPKVPYTDADLEWNDSTSRSSVEMRGKSFRPELADMDAHAEQYDTIFLGFPVWWYVPPTIVNTFLDTYDLTDKTIVLFATLGGSGFGKTVDGLKGSAPGATIREGELLDGRAKATDLKKWADGLGCDVRPGGGTDMSVTMSDIREAMERVSPHVIQTPMIRMEHLDARLGYRIHIKAENMQRTGAFNLRGAVDALLSLSPWELGRGVVAVLMVLPTDDPRRVFIRVTRDHGDDDEDSILVGGIVERAALAKTMKAELRRSFTTGSDPEGWDVEGYPDEDMCLSILDRI